MMGELTENIKKILSSAELVYSNKDFTSATILYFKAVFSVIDLILLKSEGKAPKDHTERFRVLEKSYPDLYEFLDKYFKIYRDTYSTTIDKETCDKVKENVKRIIERYKV
ncbi:hypothetical protein KY343_00465 [Candidatus Woesearchaeota archaeon]|nr:hypothetical protein [Candidatus Woesearchaeota archaeon]